MAFQLNGLDPSNSGSGGAAMLGTYRTATDAKAAVLAAGYFNEAAGNLRWCKALLISASDGMFIASIDSDGATVVAAEYQPGGDTSDFVTTAQLDERLSADQRTAINALIAPAGDFADLTEATAAVAAIINALKA